MNVQTERLADHTARFTVEVELERLEEAKRVAAKKIAKRVNIPGFRKGKAPYRILLNYVGEAAILEDALEVLGNEVYKDALDQTDIEPYGPGSLEDFGVEPQPTFKFVVPLQPVVDLGDYRDIRVEYEAPTVEDKQVEDGLKNLQEQHALVEESQQPVAADNRVTVDIVGEILEDEAESEADADADAEEAESGEATEAEEETADEADRQIFVDQQDVVFTLTEDNEPAPGFTDALAGATVGEQRVFELTYPEDEEEFQQLSGKHVRFDVTVKKIETVTLPALNDEFAAHVTEDEDEPLTLLSLRMRIREDLQKAAEENATNEYSEKVLNQIIEGSTISFPEALVDDQVNHLLQHVDMDLRQRGLTLEDYMKVTGKSLDDMRSDYRDNSIETIKRSLVIRELVQAENVEITDERMSEEIDRIVAQFGEQAELFRSMYDRPDMQDNLRSDLLNRLVFERIAQIAKGEAPALTAQEENAEDAEATVTETETAEAAPETTDDDVAAEEGE
ncbi:MAG: trigger factor [Anaerolineae bacterium]|nr:trigger factor [Anaerolineae bacterium]